MDIFETIEIRRSIRRYLDKSVEPEKLTKILDAGRMAPSAKNWQDWRFVVVQNDQTRQRLIQAASDQVFVGQAPVVIACCTVEPDYMMSCGQPLGAIDVAISVDHITLAAAALGLGTCWIGAFDPEKVREILKIPKTVGIVELLTLGYPAENPDARPREELDKLVYYECWKKP